MLLGMYGALIVTWTVTEEEYALADIYGHLHMGSRLFAVEIRCLS